MSMYANRLPFLLLAAVLTITSLFVLDGRALVAGREEFERPPQQDLQARVVEIFDNHCALVGCHVGATAPKNLDLSEEVFVANLVNVKSAEVAGLKRVRPGDPATSYLVMKIKGALGIEGEKMPRGGKPLSEVEVAAIEGWIRSLPPGSEPERQRHTYARAFPGLTLANLPTAEVLERGTFLYRISHRFKSPTNTGFDELFGLDGGAFMLTQLAFPVTTELTVTVARSNVNATFEFGAKYRLLREKTNGSAPLSAAVYAGLDWETLKEIPDPENPATELGRSDSERFHFFAQLALTKQLGGKVSLLAAPGILLQGNVGVKEEDPLVTVGIGASFTVLEGLSLFIESVPILSGDETAATIGGLRTEEGKRVFNDAFAIGLERRIGGHVFHVFVSNSGGASSSQYMSGGNLDFAAGDFCLGFNIYRILNYPF